MTRVVISRFALAVVFCSVAAVASATPFTLTFTASGFVISGTQYPGFDGSLSGTVSWDAAAATDPIAALTAFDLTIYDHTFGLSEVGIAFSSEGRLALWAAPFGPSVTNVGSVTDFVLTLDRAVPAIDFFAYGLVGKPDAIWWEPSFTLARFVDTSPEPVPEPTFVALSVTGFVAFVVMRRRRPSTGAR